MAAFVCLLVTLTSIFRLSIAQEVDQTLQIEASGTDVVLVVVNRITAAFGSDNLFLRRVAYVETKDGTDSDTFRSGYFGGIWQVDEEAFRETQDISTNPQLSFRYTMISETFGIDWPTVQWMDLRKPLISGLAARLFLFTFNSVIPCDISGQAAYWKTNYNTNINDTEQMYINDVGTLIQTQGCRVNSDIMFVLDGSGSVGFSNFEVVRQFVLQYVNSLPIGPMDNQVGIITFGNSAQFDFGFNTHGNRESLIDAINSIGPSGGGTNIPGALCEMQMAFNSTDMGVRADNAVFRIGIFMTASGITSTPPTRCGYSTVEDATEAIRSLIPPILVFAISVGPNVNFEQIRAIASGPQFISNADLFSIAEFECIQAVQENNLCFRASTPMNLEDVNMGTLDQGEEIRWEFLVPTSGVTCFVTANQGSVVFYASTRTTAPNEAFYEWRAATSSTTSVNIVPQQSSATGSAANSTVPVFVTISGMAASNSFSLSTQPVSFVRRLSSSCVIQRKT